MIKRLKYEIQSKPYYFIASILAILGAHLTSGTVDFERAIGFGVWIISNGYFGFGFYQNRNYFPAITFLIYEIYNIRGLLNNL